MTDSPAGGAFFRWAQRRQPVAPDAERAAFEAGFAQGGAWAIRTSSQLAGISDLMRRLLTLLDEAGA